MAILSLFRHATSGLSHIQLRLTPLPALAPQMAAALLFIAEAAGLYEEAITWISVETVLFTTVYWLRHDLTFG